MHATSEFGPSEFGPSEFGPSKFDAAFRRRYGIGSAEALPFLYAVARALTARGTVDPEDLTHDFVIKKVVDGPAPSGPIRDPYAFLRRALAYFFIDVLRAAGRLATLLGDEPDGRAADHPGTDGIEFTCCFWHIVEDSRFPPLPAESIGLRLDRETLDTQATWQKVATDMGCTRTTARCYFERGIRRFFAIFRHGWQETL